ncbi:hypothetical protein [Micromonospora echinaurantiaca]|uniref:hypothetical protein n=1 Tax=Micromonospora echinaurantiaca TaxID=47857 RepID=UPI00341AFAB3
MSPDASWVQWLVIVAALVQSTAAVIQISQGRRQSGSRTEAAKPAVPVDDVLRVGVVTIVLGVMAIYAAPRVAALGLDHTAENLYETVLIIISCAGPFAAVTTILLALAKVFEKEETPTDALVHSLAAVAATGVLIMEVAMLTSGT